MHCKNIQPILTHYCYSEKIEPKLGYRTLTASISKSCVGCGGYYEFIKVRTVNKYFIFTKKIHEFYSIIYY